MNGPNPEDTESGHHSLGSSRDQLGTPSESNSHYDLDTVISHHDQPSSSSLLSTAHSSTASVVMPPILIKDARTRSYLVGTIGSQDSLLGSEELVRHFPDGKLRLLVVSWNMSSNHAPGNINDLILPEEIVQVPDVLAIGVQEAPGSGSDIRDWEVQLQTTLGPSHVMIHSCSLGVLHLAIFVRRDLIWFCSVPEDDSFNSRASARNIVKTKGAIAVSFSFFGTSFLFINCHLAAHENKMQERLDDYEKITRNLNLPRNMKMLKPRYISSDVTARFDAVFWFGDLNFRVERPVKEVMELIDEIRHQSSPSMECLLESDQLTRAMDAGVAFRGFSEADIDFFPTYKFRVSTDDYDSDSLRVPSFTDRILCRSKRPGHIAWLRYESVPQLTTSDHKPIFGLFEVRLRPARESGIVFNAGQFNRDVYVEALKRRSSDAEWEMRRGSLVCTIS